MIKETSVGSKGKPTFCKYWNMSIDTLEEEYLRVDMTAVNLALAQAFIDSGMYVSRLEGEIPIGDTFTVAYRGIVWTDKPFSNEDMLKLIEKLPEPFDKCLVFNQYTPGKLLQLYYVPEHTAKQLAERFPLEAVI